jgi:uncharacterized membrane protein YdbT with pleckstrin-like domain
VVRLINEEYMKLDDGETLELEARPDEKILAIWFLTKTITYSLATMFFVFTILFFINTINVIFEAEESRENQTEIVQDGMAADQAEELKDGVGEELDHPFGIIANYWEWALAFVCAAAVLIQIYLIYLRRTYRYIVTNRRCIFVGGILKRIERSVPYKKITDIQRSQNIIERMLGIWNVQVFTPGTASMQIGQAKARAELNFDGLMNSEDMYAAINRHTQLNG